VLLPCITKSQNDSLKKTKRVQNFIGGSSGLLIGSAFNEFPAGLTFGIQHITGWKHACIKFNANFTPSENYGLVQTYFLSAGFTTKMENIISWHLCFGYGGEVYKDGSDNYTTGDAVGPISTGVYGRFKKNSKHLIGFESYIYVESNPRIASHGYGYSPSLPIGILLSYNYKF